MVQNEEAASHSQMKLRATCPEVPVGMLCLRHMPRQNSNLVHMQDNHIQLNHIFEGHKGFNAFIILTALNAPGLWLSL